MRCDAPQLQLEQRAAFASHEALAAALDETHRTTIALHTYEASAECRTALFDALPLRWKAGDRVARIEWHNRSPADEQGALWRAALARELGASAPVEDAAPSARSAARFPYRFAIVLRCDLLLYDGEQLLRRLLRTWESDQRQPVFAFPSANWYRQRQPPTSEGDGVNSTSASHRFLLAGKPVDTPAPLDGPLLPTTRMFACREFAMLLTRSPSVSDQLHLIPASLFVLATSHFFGHNAIQCLREHSHDGRRRPPLFLLAKPKNTDTSICANELFSIIGRERHPPPCDVDKDYDFDVFEKLCGVRVMRDHACLQGPLTQRRCGLEGSHARELTQRKGCTHESIWNSP